MGRANFPILFITATRIGDAVLSSGLLKRLADEVPNARFTVVAGPVAAPLFAQVPNLDRLIVMEKGKGKAHWFKLWSQVRHKKWGLIVDLRGSAISGFLRRDRRAVHRKNFGEPVHKVVQAARVLTLEDDPPSPYLFTSEETEARAEALTAGEGPILAIGPSANWIGKVWPTERFGQTAKSLLADELKGGRLMVLGGKEDRMIADELIAAFPKDQVIDLVGQADLPTVYACLKRARLFVGNDSGLMHMAAAAGVPTIGLFGPSDDLLYAPWGPKARSVRGPREFEQFVKLDPDLSQSIRHMIDLPVASVLETAKELLAATAEQPEPSAAEPVVKPRKTRTRKAASEA